jgi:fructose-bisphosphate aldolase class II
MLIRWRSRLAPGHGAYKFKGEPKLDFERLRKIEKMIPGFPIVLHGSSSVPQELVAKCNQYGGQLPGAKGVPEDMLREAAKSAVCKINIDTDLRLAMTATIREVFATSPGEYDPRKYLGPGRTAVKELVRHKIVHVLGSNGKA